MTDATMMFRNVFTKSLLLIALFEILSYCGFVYPAFSSAAFLAIVGVTVVLAVRDLELAFLVLLAELCIGSQGGYLVSYGLMGGLNLSLRMGLFLAVGGVWLAKRVAALLQPGTRAAELATLRALPRHPLAGPTLALAVAFAIGIARGVLRGNGTANVFFDANGYLYLALLPVFVGVVASHRMRMAVAAVVAATVFTTTAKALFVEFVFSHRLFSIAKPVYVWIRDTRVGEITIQTGDFYRVFFQAHLFALFFLFIAVLQLAYLKDWKGRSAKVLLGIVLATGTSLLLSLSRSFWFGGAAGVLVLAAALAWGKANWHVWKRLSILAMTGLVGGMAVILFTYAFPFPPKGSDVAFGELFGRRAFSFAGEAAANSRWILLPELVKVGREHPVLGSGLGTEVTYRTEDPRLLADNPTGEYTTFAFEWGYHDLWVKFGALGLAAYAWFLWAVLAPWVRKALAGRAVFACPRTETDPATDMAPVVALGVSAGLIALLATNVFSPYLNHPLGLGLLMLAAAFIYGEDRTASV
jgi:hypothetical protein